MKRFSWSLVVLALVQGCDGCNKTERASPLRYVDKSAEAVVEIRDISALAAVPGYIEKHLGSVITKPQIDSLREELQLTVGFDLLTPEGLAKAGLATKGAIVGAIAADGTGALWVIPVDKPAVLQPTLESQLKARVGGDKITKTKAGTVDVTTLATAFGPTTAVRAAYGFAHGYLFLGLGSGATDAVTKAIAAKPADSVLEHPEYRALVQSLGEAYHVRIIAPGGGAALTQVMKLLSTLIPQVPQIDIPLEAQVRGAGWVFELAPGAAQMRGRVRMSDDGLKIINTVFNTKTPVGPAVQSLDLPGSVLHVQGAADIVALTTMLAPPGSPPRDRLDGLFGKIRQDVAVDMETEIFPLLTGHAALAIGVGSLEGKAFRELIGNPRGVLWTAFALGAEDPAAIAEKETRLDEGLKVRGMAIAKRTFNNIELRTVAPEGGGATLVETFVLPKGWVFSNEPVIADRIILNGGGKDRLNGKAGLAVELRMKVLAAQIESFDKNSLPLLWRGAVSKGVDVVKLFDRAEVSVMPAADGLEINGGLVFAK